MLACSAGRVRVASGARSAGSRSGSARALLRCPRQPVLAALGVALEQAELDERGGVAVGGRGAHAGVVGEFDDPPRGAVGAEAGEQREPSQQRPGQARIGCADRQIAPPRPRASLVLALRGVPPASSGALSEAAISVEMLGARLWEAARTTSSTWVGDSVMAMETCSLLSMRTMMAEAADDCLHSVIGSVCWKVLARGRVRWPASRPAGRPGSLQDRDGGHGDTPRRQGPGAEGRRHGRGRRRGDRAGPGACGAGDRGRAIRHADPAGSESQPDARANYATWRASCQTGRGSRS